MSWTRRGFIGAGIATVAGVAAAKRTEPADITIAVAPSRSSRSAPPSPTAPPELDVLSDGPAPSLAAASGWINTDPLLPEALHGNVVLYDFWTYGCINCQHTLPAVKAWHDRYAADGFIVASIHTAEFAHERERANVEAYVAEQQILYPVALDPDREIWRAFRNRYWPAFFLYDRENRWRYHHIGERAYQTTEDAIRTLLAVPDDAPRADHDLDG